MTLLLLFGGAGTPAVVAPIPLGTLGSSGGAPALASSGGAPQQQSSGGLSNTLKSSG